MATTPPANDPLSLAGLGIVAPPMVAGGSVRQPLGPPTGFYGEQKAVQGEAADPDFIAQGPYVNGDEWMPAYGMETADRDRLKARMNAAGLYGSAGYQSGNWTRNDADAYQQVLEAANGMGRRDPEVVIDNIANEVRKGPRVQGPRAPLVSHISNPDSIRAVIRDSALSLTGSRLSDADEQRLISLYQGQQQAASQAAYAAGDGTAGGTGGTITDPAGVQAFANAQVEQMRPEDTASHRYIGAFNKILGSMGTLAQATPTYQGKGLPNETQAVM